MKTKINYSTWTPPGTYGTTFASFNTVKKFEIPKTRLIKVEWMHFDTRQVSTIPRPSSYDELLDVMKKRHVHPHNISNVLPVNERVKRN